MSYPEKSLLFDLSTYSPGYYGPPGGNYGLGRVAIGYARALADKFHKQLGLCSYLSSAESVMILNRDNPNLLPHSIESPVRFLEKHAIAWTDPTDDNQVLRADFTSKLRRYMWHKSWNDHRYRFDSSAKSHYANAKLIHSDLNIPLEVRSKKAKKIVTVNDLIPIRFGSKPSEKEKLTSLLKKAESLGSHFCCYSMYTAQDLADYLGISPDRIHCAPLGIEDTFQPCHDQSLITAWRNKLNIKENQRYIIANTGELRRKNLIQIINVVHHLRKIGHSDLQLVFAGVTKTLPQEFEELVHHSIGWKNFTHFTNFISDIEFSILYSGAELMLFLSLSEGFGLPPLEAMACGAPVVCSNKTSLPEVCGTAAIMVDPDDIDSIVTHADRILKDQLCINDLSSRSLAQAKKFTWSNTAEYIETVWNRVLS